MCVLTLRNGIDPLMQQKMEKGGTTAAPLCDGPSPPYLWAHEALQDCPTTSDDFISVSSGGGSLPCSPYSSPRSTISIVSSLPDSSPTGILTEDDDNRYDSVAHHHMMPSPPEPSPIKPYRHQGTKGFFLDSSLSSANAPKQQSCAFKDLHRDPDESPGSFRGLLPSAASSIASRDDSSALQSIVDINGRSSRSLLSTDHHHISFEALLPPSPPRSAAADALKADALKSSTFCGRQRHPSLIHTTEASEDPPAAASLGALRRPLITTTAATATAQHHEPSDGRRDSISGLSRHLLSPSFPSAHGSLPIRALYTTGPRADGYSDDAPSASIGSFRNSRRRSAASLIRSQANEITTSSTTTTTRTTTTTTTTTKVQKSSNSAIASSAFCSSSSASRFEPGIPPLPRCPSGLPSSMTVEDADAADMDAQMMIHQHQQRPLDGGMMRSDGASDQAIFSGGSSSADDSITHRSLMSESPSRTSPRGASAADPSSRLRCNLASSKLQQQCSRYRIDSSLWSACAGRLGSEHQQLKQQPISSRGINSRCSVIAAEDSSSVKISSSRAIISTSSAAVASSVLMERDSDEHQDDDAVAAAPWTTASGDDGVSIGSSISSHHESCAIDRFLEVCRDTRVTAALATLDFKRRLPYLGPVLPRSASSASAAGATDGTLEAEEARPPSIKGTITALWALLAKTGMLHEECSVTAVFTAVRLASAKLIGGLSGGVAWW